jgi:tetratricopeptide (TPR) repeat protein
MRATALLQEALKLDQERPNQTGEERAAILNNLGGASLKAGDTEQARAFFESAREAAVAELGPRHPRIAIYDSSLAFALLASDPPAALDVGRRAVRAAWRTLNDVERAKLLTPIGIAQLQLGQSKKAHSALGYARTLFEDNLGFAHPSLALALRYEAAAVESIDPGYSERLLSRAEELDLSTVQSGTEDVDWIRRIEEASGRGDQRSAARFGLILGKARLDRGAWESARDVLKDTVRRAELAGSEWTRADAHLMLGHAYELAELDEQARMSYRASATAFERLGGVHGQTLALLKLWGLSDEHRRRMIVDELSRLRTRLRGLRKLKTVVDRIIGLAQDSSARS